MAKVLFVVYVPADEKDQLGKAKKFDDDNSEKKDYTTNSQNNEKIKDAVGKSIEFNFTFSLHICFISCIVPE